jgi:hypothetical protein
LTSRLKTLSQRRAHLVAEIGRERGVFHTDYAAIRQDLAFAGLGLMVGKLLTRHTWWRAISLAVLAIIAGRRLTPKSEN